MLQFDLLNETNAYQRFMLKHIIETYKSQGQEITIEVVMTTLFLIKIGSIKFDSIEIIMPYYSAPGFSFVGNDKVDGNKLKYDLINGHGDKIEVKTATAYIAPGEDRNKVTERLRAEWKGMDNKTDPLIGIVYNPEHDEMRFFAYKAHEYVHGQSIKTVDLYRRQTQYSEWQPTTSSSLHSNEFASLELAVQYVHSNALNTDKKIENIVEPSFVDLQCLPTIVRAPKRKKNKSTLPALNASEWLDQES